MTTDFKIERDNIKIFRVIVKEKVIRLPFFFDH